MSATYRVTYPTGRAADEYDTYDEAVAAVREEWEDAEIGHDGDLTDGGDRTLCWATEEDSLGEDGMGDAGQRACCSITRCGG